MNLKKVLFLGGSNDHLVSVQVRCLDIALKLGCDYFLSGPYPDKVLDRYSAFICVKPDLAHFQLDRLARKGIVIWDVIDGLPPREHVEIYLVSSKIAKEIFQDYGRIVHIPHHHCNFSGIPNPSNLRHPGWIGSRHWHPKMRGFEYDYYEVLGMSREDVVKAHRRIGISLNFRANSPFNINGKQGKLLQNFHVAINSGIKLINCLGFGTPSVSCVEPAYEEIGPNCTIFSDLKKCAHWVRALQSDDAFYMELRKKCLRKAEKYHIDSIVEKYRKLLHSL